MSSPHVRGVAKGVKLKASGMSTICSHCTRQFSKYTCPRCNAPYCSADCYKGHNSSCTENFTQATLKEHMKGTKSSEAERFKMLQSLKRVEQEDSLQARSFVDERENEKDAIGDDHLSDEELQNLLKSLSIEAEGGGHGSTTFQSMKLTGRHRRAFMKALSRGELSEALEIWYPWWEPPPDLVVPASSVAGLASLNPSAPTQPVPKRPQVLISVEGTLPWPYVRMQDTAPPLPDLVSLKPFAQLISSAPSPNLYFNLVDLIFAYVYTLRLFNGDIEYDLPSCFSSLFTVSLVLSSPATAHASVEAALEACSSAALGHPSTQSSPSFCASAIRDTAQVMYFTPLILRALAHMRGILQRLQQEQRAADKKPSKSQTKVNSPDDSQKTDSKRNSFRALALARKQKQKKHATNSRGLGGGDKLALMRAGGVRGVAREGTRSDKPRKRRKGRSKLQSLAELEHKLYFYTCWIHSYHTVSILENKEETNAVTKLQGAVKLVELGDAISLAWRKRTKGIHIAQSTKRQHTVVDRLKI